jgi:hypothetical protein
MGLLAKRNKAKGSLPLSLHFELYMYICEELAEGAYPSTASAIGDTWKSIAFSSFSPHAHPR